MADYYGFVPNLVVTVTQNPSEFSDGFFTYLDLMFLRKRDSSIEAINITADNSKNFVSITSKLSPSILNYSISNEAPIETNVAVPRIIPKNVAVTKGINFV